MPTSNGAAGRFRSSNGTRKRLEEDYSEPRGHLTIPAVAPQSTPGFWMAFRDSLLGKRRRVDGQQVEEPGTAAVRGGNTLRPGTSHRRSKAGKQLAKACLACGNARKSWAREQARPYTGGRSRRNGGQRGASVAALGPEAPSTTAPSRPFSHCRPSAPMVVPSADLDSRSSHVGRRASCQGLAVGLWPRVQTDSPSREQSWGDDHRPLPIHSFNKEIPSESRENTSRMCFWCEYISCPVPPPVLVSNDSRNVDAYFTTTIITGPATGTIPTPRFCPLINLPGNLSTCLDQTPDAEKVLWYRSRLEKMDCSLRVLKRYLSDPGYRPQLIGLLLRDCEWLHKRLREGLTSFWKTHGLTRRRRGRRGRGGRGQSKVSVQANKQVW
ncbi:hypothetical protein VTN00DRAFT_1986 [Thermoascus crustaceus]|uniref:uncharacterized protein n=1 Tax=Thermoascus crustaceus TaxID=5088 RepID=UPI0037422777